MAASLLDSYESTIRKISRSHNTYGSIDVLAMEREDYESVLRVESIRLQHKFRALHGFNVNAEQRYVWKGLWNASKSLGRKRIRHIRGSMQLAAEPEAPPTSRMREMDEHLEQREAIEKLKTRLGADYNILHRAAQYRSLAASWNPEERGYSTYRRTVRRLQDQAREILKK